MSLKTLPYKASELVELLDRLHPPRCIEPDESLELAHRRAGQRDLIDKLVNAQKRTDEQSLRNAMSNV